MKLTNIKKLLPEDISKNLSDDSFKLIEESISEKIQLSIDAALDKQDSDHAEQLKTLMEAFERDKAMKLVRVIKKIDNDKATKLRNVINVYEGKVLREADEFKNDLVNKLSTYLEEYIDETIPSSAIEEATKNNTARVILKNLRESLAVGSSVMNESIKGAILDGKNKIDTLEKQVTELQEQNKKLLEKNQKVAALDLLERTIREKVTDKRKAAYLRRVLENKSVEFIKENFNYTSNLYDRQERQSVETIRTEAFKNRTVTGDAKEVREVTKVQEKTAQKQAPNMYVEELKKIK